MNDVQLLLVISSIAVFSFAMFVFMVKKDGSNLNNGLIFNVFLVSFFVAIVMAGTLFDVALVKVLMNLVLILFVFVVAFGVFVLVVGLIGNGYVVLKKESKTFANLLTLLMGLGMLAFIIIKNLSFIQSVPLLHNVVIAFQLLLVYFGLSFYNYLISAFVHGFFKVEMNKDFILVLGCGLIHGDQVSRLLASRINAGLAFYHQQKLSKPQVKLLFSGGQGDNETIPEAEAMAKYALKHGIDPDAIMVETKSTNTRENFMFSHALIQAEQENAKLVFVTSNYHVFRSGLIAKQLNIKAVGLGSKTAWYYLPNAMLREYVALLVMKKKSYAIKVILLLTLFAITLILQYQFP